ncbi:MAG: class I SAM-dependent rRNA methyltransferase [Bacteroidia bacterium]|nr:class I SAM-dependent rRNA methyltransferase [Bacteroidia bacterium]
MQGHPWVFSNSIKKINKVGKAGDIAIIFHKLKNKIIGIGLYDPESPIAIKMIHHGEGATIDAQFFQEKIHIAYSKRMDLLVSDTDSYRLIFGEADGFPGLIADVYANVLVIKLYSRIWIPYLNLIKEAMLEVTNSMAVVLRLSRNLQSSKQLNYSDGQLIYGELENEEVLFREHGIQFLANVIKGHKTGYFLDHRHNRKQVGEWSRGKTMLDVFSYAGGFSVHALANGAESVTSVDISPQALELAQNNVHLNDHHGKHLVIQGDAFKVLKELIEKKTTYDIVVIDPPSFAKRQSEVVMAKKKYKQLAQLGQQLTAKNGLLVLASCSSRVSAQEFHDLNNGVLLSSDRNFKLIKKTQHDSDHPISFKEGAYLKCGYYRFLD